MFDILPYQKLPKCDQLPLILDAIDKISLNRNKLILLVGLSGSGKTKILQELSNHLDTSVYSIGYEVSKAMVEGLSNDKILDYLQAKLEQQHSIIILDNLEVLFAHSLNMSPLVILNRLSTSTVVLSSFPGKVVDGDLIFAEASSSEHKIYNKYDLKEIILFEILGEIE